MPPMASGDYKYFSKIEYDKDKGMTITKRKSKMDKNIRINGEAIIYKDQNGTEFSIPVQGYICYCKTGSTSDSGYKPVSGYYLSKDYIDGEQLLSYKNHEGYNRAVSLDKLDDFIKKHILEAYKKTEEKWTYDINQFNEVIISNGTKVAVLPASELVNMYVRRHSPSWENLWKSGKLYICGVKVYDEKNKASFCLSENIEKAESNLNPLFRIDQWVPKTFDVFNLPDNNNITIFNTQEEYLDFRTKQLSFINTVPPFTNYTLEKQEMPKDRQFIEKLKKTFDHIENRFKPIVEKNFSEEKIKPQEWTFSTLQNSTQFDAHTLIQISNGEQIAELTVESLFKIIDQRFRVNFCKHISCGDLVLYKFCNDKAAISIFYKNGEYVNDLFLHNYFNEYTINPFICKYEGVSIRNLKELPIAETDEDGFRFVVDKTHMSKKLRGKRNETITELKNKIKNLEEQKQFVAKLGMQGIQEEELLAKQLEEAKKEIEQLQVQLAGCGAAALGATSPNLVAKKGDYGWSPAYQDILDLRLKYEKLLQENGGKFIENNELKRQIENKNGIIDNLQASLSKTSDRFLDNDELLRQLGNKNDIIKEQNKVIESYKKEVNRAATEFVAKDVQNMELITQNKNLTEINSALSKDSAELDIENHKLIEDNRILKNQVYGYKCAGEEFYGKYVKLEENSFSNMIKNDAIQTVYRIGATQMMNALKASIVALLQSTGKDNQTIQTISDLLDSDIGVAILSCICGYSVNELVKDNEIAQKFSQELRVHGLTLAGNAAFETLFQLITSSIVPILENIPQENIRVAANKAVEENIVEEKQLLVATN